MFTPTDDAGVRFEEEVKAAFLAVKKTAHDALVALLRKRSPHARVHMLTSLRAATAEQPYNGYHYDIKPGVWACCGSAMNKIRDEKEGFVLTLSLGDSVHVGYGLKRLRECRNELGWKVTDRQLRQLSRNGEEVFFVRPEYPDPIPVYVLTEKLTVLAKMAGLKTRNAKHKKRSIRDGDEIVILPPPATGYWFETTPVFPSGGLPPYRYRAST